MPAKHKTLLLRWDAARRDYLVEKITNGFAVMPGQHLTEAEARALLTSYDVTIIGQHRKEPA